MEIYVRYTLLKCPRRSFLHFVFYFRNDPTVQRELSVAADLYMCIAHSSHAAQ